MRTIRLQGILVLSATWLLLSSAAGAQTPDLSTAVAIDNFGRVSATYFRGSQPEGDDYAVLASLGVKTVINLIGDGDLDAGEQRQVESHGMRYVHIPMTTREAPTAEQQALFLSIVNAAEHQPVYVHCVGGKHRTGVMTAVYRMTNDGLTGKQAFKEMKQFKYGWDFLHPEFKEFVYAFKPSERTAVAAAAAAQQQ
jgi:protein tyrosine/serine phosphatase